jgi:hypothetical protein
MFSFVVSFIFTVYLSVEISGVFCTWGNHYPCKGGAAARPLEKAASSLSRRGLIGRRTSLQSHAALGAIAGLVADDLGVHRADELVLCSPG